MEDERNENKPEEKDSEIEEFPDGYNDPNLAVLTEQDKIDDEDDEYEEEDEEESEDDEGP
jgi:hypothetical protein